MSKEHLYSIAIFSSVITPKAHIDTHITPAIKAEIILKAFLKLITLSS